MVSELVRTRNLMVKLTYLTAIALTTSAVLLGLIVAFNAFGEFTSFDMVINTICVLLMNTKYQNIYFKICGKCHEMLVRWCCGVGVLFGNRKDTGYDDDFEEYDAGDKIDVNDNNEKTGMMDDKHNQTQNVVSTSGD